MVNFAPDFENKKDKIETTDFSCKPSSDEYRNKIIYDTFINITIDVTIIVFLKMDNIFVYNGSSQVLFYDFEKKRRFKEK